MHAVACPLAYFPVSQLAQTERPVVAANMPIPQSRLVDMADTMDTVPTWHFLQIDAPDVDDTLPASHVTHSAPVLLLLPAVQAVQTRCFFA